MRTLTRIVLIIGCVTWLGQAIEPDEVHADSNCPDSTEVLVPIFGWDIPADGWDIAVGTNGFVYVTDPVSDRICRYSLYGGGEMCWESPDPMDPGQFVQPRWLAWNPVNDRLYVSGQYGPPTVPVFGASGNFLFDIKGDSLSTEPGQFAGPTWSIAIDPVTGYVWVYENNTLESVTVDRIQEFDLNGNFTGRVFDRGANCKLQGNFVQVEDIAVDSTGSVYLLDVGTFPAASEVHRVVPGVGCVAHWGHQGGPGGLTSAINIAIDKDGFINVLDWNSSGTFVRKYNRAGSHVSSLQIGPPSEDFSLALDFMHGVADPFMFVARFQPHRVEVFGPGIEPMNVLETSWVDPTSFQLKTDDLALLAECKTGPQEKRIPMKSVAADGVSPLLLRLHLPEPGTVQWKVTDPDQPGITENIGTLATLDSAQTGLVIEAPVETVENEHIAFAVYTAPIDFERPSVPADHAVGERPLRVTAEFMPNSGVDTVVVVSDLTIQRPTVLFLHGWLEESARWTPFKSILTATDASRWGNGKVIIADYASTSGDSLTVNARALENYLTSAIASARDSLRIVSAQVDIISHSMGGLVLRRLADATPQDPFRFRSTANMGRGYYHKALFLNTPHQGSPMADITVTLRNIMNSAVQPERRLLARTILSSHARMSGANFNQLIGGAIDDMSLGSDVLAELQPFATPTHAHVGSGGSDLWFTPRLLDAAGKRFLVAYVGLVASITNLPELLLFDTEVHDIAVLWDSQLGGLSNSGHYVTANFEDGLHESSFFSSISGSRARDWATRSVSDASFFAPSLPGGSALAPETQRWMGNLTQAIEDEMPEFAGVTVRIVTPSSGFSKIPGDSFLVEVDSYSDISTVVVTYPGGALFMDSTLTGYVHTDSAFSGPFELSALALMADGTVGRSESVTGTVRPPVFVTLTSIKVTPPSVSLSGVGSLLDLRVVGTYSDGVERDVSSAASGATYSGFDPGVISVPADGVIRGAGPGVTTVTVQNGTFSKVVRVEVGDGPPINNRPHAIAGGPYQICNGEGVALDASASFDFDGGPLTYAWDLNGDGQFSDLVGQSAFYSPPYIADEQLVGLRVTDSGGGTSEDYTTIQVPLACFKGVRVCAVTVYAAEASDLGVDAEGDIYIFHNLGTSGSISNAECGLRKHRIFNCDL